MSDTRHDTAAPSALSAFASNLMDRVVTAWSLMVVLVLLETLAVYLTLQLTTRSTARCITGPAGRRSLAESRTPQLDPLLLEDDGALRMAAVLSFVETIRPDALREDLGMENHEFARTLASLRGHGFLLRESADGDQTWLRPTLGGHRAMRDHLADLVPIAAGQSARPGGPSR